MDYPDAVATELGDEEVVATVTLADEEMLVVTPTRSLRYQADGLLRGESVEEFPHEASRLTVDEGRRATKVRFEYPRQDARAMSVPPDALANVIQYVVAGMLNARGITETGEAVHRVFRFNELTLVLTDRQLVTHVGTAVWGEEHDQFAFDELTGLEFEEGALAAQIVLYVDGHSERIKVPPDRFEELKEDLIDVLTAYFELEDPAALDEVLGRDTPAVEGTETTASGLTLSGDLEPIELGTPGEDKSGQTDERTAAAESTNTEAAATATTVSESETAAPDPVDDEALRAAVRDLEASIERQRELLDQQAAALETLVTAIEQDRGS